MSTELLPIEVAASLIHRKPQNLRMDIRNGKCNFGFAIGKRCFINADTFKRTTGYSSEDIERGLKECQEKRKRYTAKECKLNQQELK